MQDIIAKNNQIAIYGANMEELSHEKMHVYI